MAYLSSCLSVLWSYIHPYCLTIHKFPFVFADVCKNCNHVIARHEYTFSVVDEYQVSGVWFIHHNLVDPCHLLIEHNSRVSASVVLQVCLFNVQEYTMLCMLCGKAEDSISVLPDDPRQSAPLF